MSENMSMWFKAKMKPVKPLNDEMTLFKCYIMALGKNNNKSNISKEAADDALPTLFNIPVVGHIYLDEEGKQHMGGHDMTVEKNEDGKYVLKMITVPYGTVPYQEDVHYEEVVERDGTKNIYQVADIILWTARYPELLETKYDDEIYFNQSMEIKVLESKKHEDHTDILKYQYRALCLLGKDDDQEYNHTPCFPSARVEAYNFALDDKWDELFEEFKNKLGECYEGTRSFEEGGKDKMDNEMITKILGEFGIEDAAALSFEITEDMTEEALRDMLQKEQNSGEDFSQNSEELGQQSENEPVDNNDEQNNFSSDNSGDENNSEPSIPTVEDDSFELTANTKRSKLVMLAKTLAARDTHCWLVDYDDKFLYIMETPCCDYDNHKTYRVMYTEENTEYHADIETKEEVYAAWLTAQEVKERDEKEQEYQRLVEFEKNQIEENKKREYADVISEFADLSEIEEFKATVGNALNFASAEELKEKLFAIRGRHGKYKKAAVVDTVIPIENKGKQGAEDYETRFFSKYLPQSLKK